MDEIEPQSVSQVSPATFARLVEEAPDGVVILRDGVIVYVNRAALALLQYDRAEQLVGQSMALFLDAQSIQTMVRRIRHMQTTGERFAPREYRAKRRDGSSVVAEISSIPIEFEGKPAVLAFVRDVTERVQLRAQLEQADRLTALGVMAAGVAHEINNPLTFISLATDLLRQRLGADEGNRGLLEDIGEGVERIAAIVRDLRVYSRYEDEPLGAVDLEAVLHSAGRIVAHELRSRVRLVRETDSLPLVRGVARRLEQVFVNVYLNAAQAFPDDQHDASISVRPSVTEKTVEVEVSDNGSGMPTDVLERIFEPFFTMRPTGAGTGLGLFICKDILLRAGGNIRAESEVGRGTTVTISLQRALTPAAQIEPSPTSKTPLSGRRILVVDDEPLIVSTIVRALGRDNVVVGETNPERALELAFADPPFDVIVCDMMMEGLTGVDVYERIARERPGMEMRIVFVSGGAHTARTRAFLARVPNRCLTKPFAPEGLSSVLAQVAAT